MTDRQTDQFLGKVYLFFGILLMYIICGIISALIGIDFDVVCGTVGTLIVVSFLGALYFRPHWIDDVGVISQHMARQGWSVHQIEEGKNLGKVYYYNSVTGESTWQIPTVSPLEMSPKQREREAAQAKKKDDTIARQKWKHDVELIPLKEYQKRYEDRKKYYIRNKYIQLVKRDDDKFILGCIALIIATWFLVHVYIIDSMEFPRTAGCVIGIIISIVLLLADIVEDKYK